MTTSVWCELVCRQCANSTSGQFVAGRPIPLRSMKREAKAKGWLFKHNEVFCCKSCAKVYEEAHKELK